MLRKILKLIGYTVAALLATLVAVVALALGIRALEQQRHATALHIGTRNGIEEGRYVEIGGLQQWLQIRGENIDNPVLLFVHGGPALSLAPFTYRSMRSWEQQFTVVQWDQRGAGRTFLLNGGADETGTGMQQLIDDGLLVADHLRQYLHKDKIIVMGESFGSAIALEMARSRPDLFYAFVGTGQEISMPHTDALGYQLLRERLQAEHDEQALQQLTALGAPPYADKQTELAEQTILAAHPAETERASMFGGMGGDFMTAPGYSLRDSFMWIAGPTQHRNLLVADNQQYEAAAKGTRFEVPVFFFQGDDDIQAPISLVKDYAERISAPQKMLVTFGGGGHNAWYFLSERFLEQLSHQVRPLAVQ